MYSPAFSASLPLRERQNDARVKRVQHHVAPAMTARRISRRNLGRIAFSATAAALVSPLASSAAGKPSFIKDESGISYFDVETGTTGSYPQDGDFVTVSYEAFLSNGKMFDSRTNFVFRMGERQVIPGLEYAIQGMRPGGRRKAVFPPALAYGKRGVCLEEGGDCLVQPDETLGYDVTLQRVAAPPI